MFRNNRINKVRTESIRNREHILIITSLNNYRYNCKRLKKIKITVVL